MAERHVTAEDIRKELTPEMQRLADQIGIDAVLCLIDARGGTSVYVPHRAEADTALSQIIGADAAGYLSALMAGSHLKLPTCRSARVLWWSTKVDSTAELALKFALDQRSVHRILARVPSGPRDEQGNPLPSPQLDMFASP
ncbi:MAG: hypothetical protein ACT7A5_15970 [Ferrovibrionaceae bacterium]